MGWRFEKQSFNTRTAIETLNRFFPLALHFRALEVWPMKCFSADVDDHVLQCGW